MCKDCASPERYKNFPRCHSCHKAEKARLFRANYKPKGRFPERSYECGVCSAPGVTTSPTRKYCEPCAYERKLDRYRVKYLSDSDRMRLHWDRATRMQEAKASAQGELLDLIMEQEKDDRRSKIKYAVEFNETLDNVLVVL